MTLCRINSAKTKAAYCAPDFFYTLFKLLYFPP